MAAKRKTLSKKLRFEIFKRDNFTCQYCGRMAPSVVLEIDHINPVNNNGDNDLLNLITSCFDCNRGKGKKTLSDNEVLKKQQDQLKELNERRSQLEMMVKWREELNKLSDKEIDIAEKEIFRHDDTWTLSVTGRNSMRECIKRFGLNEVLEAINVSFLRYGNKGNGKDWNVAFNKIGGICYNRKKQREADEHDA